MMQVTDQDAKQPDARCVTLTRGGSVGTETWRDAAMLANRL